MKHLNNLTDINSAIGGVFMDDHEEYYYKITNFYFANKQKEKCDISCAYQLIFIYDVYDSKDYQLKNKCGRDCEESYHLSNSDEINLINKFISRLKFQNKDFDYFSPKIKIDVQVSEYELNNYKNNLLNKESSGDRGEEIYFIKGFNAAIKYLQELDKK